MGVNDEPTAMDGGQGMEELLKTTDLALLSYAEALLRDAGIASLTVDGHASVAEGSIGFLIPRRMLVRRPDIGRARACLKAAGLAEVLATPA
ncbi:MAG: DUF2007 domain-containing protein [Pseudomonadota bacterium]|jgi:hypothetical protein